MAHSIAGAKKSPSSRSPERKQLFGLEYHGSGGSEDCKRAVMRLLQDGMRFERARILTCSNAHCLLLTNEIGDLIAIKSGFSSGYGGEGPRALSFTIQLLHYHRIEIDEFEVEETLIDRLDQSGLTISDVERIAQAPAVRPSRWFQYILDDDEERAASGTLWKMFRPIVPLSIIDSRITDLALAFWDNPDGQLLTGYRRLEDIIRKRTGVSESSAKLFSRVFLGKEAILTWPVGDDAERHGRAGLFANVYMAYRNPRAHKEHSNTELLGELLLLNHLYILERQAVEV